MANFDTLPGAIANGDLSTSQYCFVQQTSGVDFEVSLSTTALVRTVGILQNDPDSSGDAAEVAISGIAKLRYGETITRGNVLVTGASGLGYEDTGTNVGLNFKLALALQSGTATGVYYVKILSPYNHTTA